eukprot:1161909-Pelagomonas_calceolata.AAC.11
MKCTASMYGIVPMLGYRLCMRTLQLMCTVCQCLDAGPLRESIAADVADDRAEEDEDKEMILGEHMVNPFTASFLNGKHGIRPFLCQPLSTICPGVKDRLQMDSWVFLPRRALDMHVVPAAPSALLL